MFSKSAENKLAKQKEALHDKMSKPCLIFLSEENHFDSKNRRSGIRKSVKIHKSHYSSPHQLIVMIWSKLFVAVTKQEISCYQAEKKSHVLN